MKEKDNDRLAFRIALTIICIAFVVVLIRANVGPNAVDSNGNKVKAPPTEVPAPTPTPTLTPTPTPTPTPLPTATPKPTEKPVIKYEQDDRYEEAVEYAISKVGGGLIYWKIEGNQWLYIQTSNRVVYFRWYQYGNFIEFSAYMNPDGTCRTYEGDWSDVPDLYKYIDYYLNKN